MSFAQYSKKLCPLYFLHLQQDPSKFGNYINSVTRFYILHCFFSVLYIIQTSIPVCTMSRYIYLYQQTSVYYALRSCFVTHGFNFNKTLLGSCNLVI